MKNLFIVLSIILIFSSIYIFSNQNDESKFHDFKGSYLGQKLPGTTPEIFAPGIVSSGLSELNSVFSPDGNEFYFCVRNPYAEAVFCIKSIDGKYTNPERLPFSDRFGEIDVSLSPDGMKMFFCSKKPISGNNTPKDDHDIWMSERIGDTWSNPVHLGDSVNSDQEDFYPVMTNNGTLYFNSQREGEGTNNIYRSRFIGGEYTKAEKLGAEINSEYKEFDPYVAPDEKFIIFTSTRPDGLGFGDFYISYKIEDGTWTLAQNMGEPINTPGPEFGPMLSPDGRFFFFTSGRRSNPGTPDVVLNYDDFYKSHNNPENNSTDIYWVDAKVIDQRDPFGDKLNR